VLISFFSQPNREGCLVLYSDSENHMQVHPSNNMPKLSTKSKVEAHFGYRVRQAKPQLSTSGNLVCYAGYIVSMELSLKSRQSIVYYEKLGIILNPKNIFEPVKNGFLKSR